LQLSISSNPLFQFTISILKERIVKKIFHLPLDFVLKINYLRFFSAVFKLQALTNSAEAHKRISNHWHWSGTIKTYLWLRIYREGDSKNVYFVFGVNDKGELYLELNCQYSNHSGGSKDVLPEHKIIAFEDYLDSSDFEIKIIDKNELVRYDWDKLIKISQDFIYKYAPLYDELEKLILDKETVNVKKEYILTPSPLPLSTKSYTKIERTFEGRKTDWSKKNTVSKLLGDEGEKLVILHEQKKIARCWFA